MWTFFYCTVRMSSRRTVIMPLYVIVNHVYVMDIVVAFYKVNGRFQP